MYFPKNKIKTGLYTSGNEFITPNGQNYIGPYWKISSGRYFTGDSPNNVPYQEIFIRGYFNITNTPTISPTETIFPTEEDYQLGEFQRYFTSRRNQPLFKEVTKTTYNNISQGKINITVNYKLFNLPWKLTGNIVNTYQVNKSVVQIIEQKEKLDGLSNFLNDYIQYYRYIPQENLYTNGGEFLTSDGKNYIGFYHTHPDKGFMVGPSHSMEPHSLLTPYITNIAKNEVIGVGLTPSHKNNTISTNITTLQVPVGAKIITFNTQSNMVTSSKAIINTLASYEEVSKID